MKVLLVGDLHIKKSNLDESKDLLDWIAQVAGQHGMTILLGDIYNDHGVVTADVQAVVTDFFTKLEMVCPKVINIEGNHDQAGDEKNSSLYVHSIGHRDLYQDRLVHIFEPNVYDIPNCAKLGLIPFRRSNDKFTKESNELHECGCNIILCHQEFNGAVYENGFYAPHGVDPQFNPKIQFVSGHIHQQQQFSNVWYPGAPRWLTKSDANSPRGLWSIEIDDTGITSRTFISSNHVSPEYHLVTLDDNSLESMIDYPKKDKIYIEYIGNNQDSIKKIQKKYKNNNLVLKNTRIKNTAQEKVSETKGITNSIKDYIESSDFNISKDLITDEIFRRIANG
jgi:DNA repair exonuclease SbcCD nuclease subunit